jgi:hypothetical protein
MAFVDCTEQSIPKPSQNKKKRRLFYSSKKKNFTVRNLYAINQKGLIIYKTKHKQRDRNYNYKVYKFNSPADLPKMP